MAAPPCTANESAEPESLFLQLTQNAAPQSAQRFVRGRRVQHNELRRRHARRVLRQPAVAAAGRQGRAAHVAESCAACCPNNGRALPPAPGTARSIAFVVRVGDAHGNPDPLLGAVLQPHGTRWRARAMSSQRWIERRGLRRPRFAFRGPVPARYWCACRRRWSDSGCSRRSPRTRSSRVPTGRSRRRRHRSRASSPIPGGVPRLGPSAGRRRRRRCAIRPPRPSGPTWA